LNNLPKLVNNYPNEKPDTEAPLDKILTQLGISIWEIHLCKGKVTQQLEWGCHFKRNSKSWAECIHPQDFPRVNEMYQNCLDSNTEAFEIEYRVILEDGEHWFSDKGQILEIDRHTESVKIIGYNQDITLQKHRENRLQHEALFDPLTGLANRRKLKQLFNQEKTAAQQRVGKIALLFLDIDGFKRINDHYGHNAGDEILCQIGERIQSIVRSGDHISRLGGDEFVILLCNWKTVEIIPRLCTRLIKLISSPYPTIDQQHQLGASIGIALFPDHGVELDMLLMRADESMYKVKATEKNNFLFFQSETHRN